MKPNIKNYLGVAIIVGVGAVALSTLLYGGFYAWTSYNSLDSFYGRTFSVTAEGAVIAIPDIARFTASVLTEGGKDLPAIQAKNTESANKVIAFVKAQDVDPKDVRTTQYSVSPRYPFYNCRTDVCPAPEISGYTVNQTVEVKIRDLSKTGIVLSGVVKNGANSVSQLIFTLDDPEKIQAEARAEAVKKAKEKAILLAEAGGFKVGKIISIYESVPGFPYGGSYDDSLKYLAAPAEAPPTTEPGSQEVTASVTVTYEMR